MIEPYSSEIRVVFDPEVTALPQYVPSNGGSDASFVFENVYGKQIPVVFINDRLITARELETVFLDLRDTYPSGYVIINDTLQNARHNSTIGSDNMIMITIVPKTDETYRKIKIQGYIISAKELGNNRIRYDFQYKYLPLEKSIVKSWSIMTTYEFYKKIAKELKLGFAVGEKVAEIEDPHFRYCCGMKIKDFLNAQISFAGLGKDSIMDFWIDAWGYINVINLYHPINRWSNDMKVSTSVGTTAVTTDMPISATHDYEIPRLITNLALEVETNIKIDSYKFNSNNSFTSQRGNTYTNYTSFAPGTKYEDVETLSENNTVAGMTADSLNPETNEFGYIKYNGFEMDELPAMSQYNHRINMLGKLSGRHAVFSMHTPNFGLHKGIQTNVVLFHYGTDTARNENSQPEDVLDNNRLPLVDVYHSGIYYITGTTFTYNIGSSVLKQDIYAIQLNMTYPQSAVKEDVDGNVTVNATAQGISALTDDSEINIK